MYNALEKAKLLDQTYLVFSSDHGYHTGQFSLPYDKRHMYEFDIRVPLLVRGPGIEKGSKINHPVAAVDFAPSLIDLMNPTYYQMSQDHFDGQSFVPLVSGGLRKEKECWRDNILIEYHGEGRLTNPGCPELGPGVSVIFQKKKIEFATANCNLGMRSRLCLRGRVEQHLHMYPNNDPD